MFIDSLRFMSGSLSNLVDNLSEGLRCDKCIDCKSYLDYMITKDDELIFRCFECKKNYKKNFNKELIKRFASIYKFCDRDIYKFILLLRKGIYPYECMDSWKRFDETLLPNNEDFYSSLNMADITDVDYRYAKRVFKNLADIFENFRNNCIEIYELDPADFFISTRISMAILYKENRNRIRIIN